MINHNNLQAIKTLADKIEYTVKESRKEARIEPVYNQCAWDIFTDDINYMYSEVSKDIIAIYNQHTRDYSNIFCDRKDAKKQISERISMSRCKISPILANEVIDLYIDLEEDDNLYIIFEDDTTEKQKATIRKKILDNITIEHVKSTGYSQGDWEVYTVVYYNDTKKEAKETIDIIIKNLLYIFTVQEYYIEKVHIETRLYTSGIEEVEEVEQEESGSIITYTGYIDDEEKELEKEGYTIIKK